LQPSPAGSSPRGAGHLESGEPLARRDHAAQSLSGSGAMAPAIRVPAMDISPVNVPSAPADLPQGAAVIAERQLFQYLSDMGLATSGVPPQLVDPAALIHQGLEGLRGFIEKAEKWGDGTLVTEMLKGPAETDRSPGPAAASLALAGSEQDAATVSVQHGGPARGTLGSSAGADQSAAMAADGLASLQRTMEAAWASSAFSVEVTLVSSGTSQIFGSANTLIRAQ
jgi:hypothetical protein